MKSIINLIIAIALIFLGVTFIGSGNYIFAGLNIVIGIANLILFFKRNKKGV